jgi:NAD(P)-dependent dehydrogenase (short-subunit alcohol dehydrogenase family)
MNPARERQTVAIVGAGRGLGRGAAQAFASHGATVIALARTQSDLLDLQRSQENPAVIVPIVGDATDPASALEVIESHQPDVLVLVAGATPATAPIDDMSWDDFAVNWEVDVRLTHHWLGAALRTPLRPGSRVIVVSSGAALAGSPLSGGYAGAKATQRFLASYAQDESRRRGLGITFAAVLPRITPHGHVGAVGSKAYAARDGISETAYAAQFGEALTPEAFGSAVRTLAHMSPDDAPGSFLLTSAGLNRLP